MKLMSQYLYKILLRNLLLVFTLYTLIGFLMALGVHAATSKPSFDTLQINSGAIQTKSVCAGFNPLVREDGLSFCRSESYSPTMIAAQPDTQLQNGQALYQSGQFSEAANLWKAAASSFQSQGDILNQALILSYLSLAYQQLGQLQQAEAAMGEAIRLTANPSLSRSNAKFILAQILNNQGQLQLIQSQPEAALETWKKSETLYKELSDRTGEIGTQLNQARALQALGFYLRARTTLEQVGASLNNQPDSQLKVAGLLNLGNVLRVTGDLTASQKILEQGLAVAQGLQSISDIQLALFSLGNLVEAQEQPQAALEYYQKAGVENSPVRLQAQIHQLDLL
ncbi:MAG: tetratricopeptide repeat protein, partial [Cyanobacteriota bacterium]